MNVMRVGIMARTFSGRSVDEVLDCITRHDIELVQFNMSCAGADTLPEMIDDELCHQIHSGFKQRQLEMVAISATYNTIDPNVTKREMMTRRAIQLIERARDLGTTFVSLCTGTRNPESMWRPHLDNRAPGSWRDLIATLERLVAAAESCGVTLGVEPEKANVVDSALQARRLLDQMQSTSLKVILDGANLLEPHDLTNMRSFLQEAFDLLGSDIALVHAKEIPNDSSSREEAAGAGQLDWDSYFRGMRSIGYDGPIVLHNLAPSQVDESVRFIRRQAIGSI
jgi:sugar phosphate isomerase/epimerase